LILTVDETLKNAQKTLFEGLKIAKIEHVVVQQLINQIERARVELDLTTKTSVIIDQMHFAKDFEFATIDLAKKANKKTSTSSYCDTMSENFQQLEKTMNEKMTKLINERLNNKTSQARSKTTLEVAKKSLSNHAKSQLKLNEEIQQVQSSEKSQTNDECSLSTSSF
jgi:predicted unusual protein kinase regulating ubiquinone biosynthesis (AarF/ABC1/UbiB family)